RFFLFGARDVWFVVALPVFLQSVLGWSYTQVGAFLALWVIGYGIVQSFTPQFTRKTATTEHGGRVSAVALAIALATVMLAIPLAMQLGVSPTIALVTGLALFGIVFALNSALHSYLIVAYADREGVSLDVGFYYMANAGGRLVGTLLSGALYQLYGLVACLVVSAVFAALSGVIVRRLPDRSSAALPDAVSLD